MVRLTLSILRSFEGFQSQVLFVTYNIDGFPASIEDLKVHCKRLFQDVLSLFILSMLSHTGEYQFPFILPVVLDAIES